jgi:hypothetical protein
MQPWKTLLHWTYHPFVTWFFAGFLLLGGGSINQITISNQRLDRALDPQHDRKLVVAGQILKRMEKPGAESLQRSFTFRVDRAILGDPAHEGKVLQISATGFDWPERLVRFATGTSCILVLREPLRDPPEVVVPTRRPLALPRARDEEPTKRILATEILAELREESSPRRQRLLILQVAPILTSKEAPALIPFLDSTDVWVKRAALATLVYATENETYLRAAAADVQHFFQTTRSSDLIDGIEPGSRYAAHRFFYAHYFFLERDSWTSPHRWNDAEASRNRGIFDAMLKLNIITRDVARIIDPTR